MGNNNPVYLYGVFEMSAAKCFTAIHRHIGRDHVLGEQIISVAEPEAAIYKDIEMDLRRKRTQCLPPDPANTPSLNQNQLNGPPC